MTTFLPTSDYIPKDANNVVTQLWTTILNELYDQPTNLECWLSHFMFTKTILRTPIHGGTQHVTSFATRIVDRSVQWLQSGGQVAQWASAMVEVRQARIFAPPYRLEGDELIIHNPKRAKALVQCGRVGCAARALMSFDVAKSNEHMLGKLLSNYCMPTCPRCSHSSTYRTTTTSRRARSCTSSTTS